VMVSRNVSTRRGPYTLHRVRDFPLTSMRRDIPTTNPLRTLIDLAGVVPADVLDDAVDRAVATKLVTVEAIRAELDRVAKQGRKGAGAMRASLERRGLKEGPHPSVLEARYNRLLKSAGLVPLRVEVVAGPHSEYRIDSLLDENVAVEVDGHIFHSTPEQKAYDERRRAEIRMGGQFLLVYTWRDIVFDGRRVLAEIHQALARFGARAPRAANRAN
jgi:very-short-patch-repair endonuclease